MSESPEDRRHNLRIEKINLAQVTRFDEEGFRADLATGRSLNLSTGGMRLELHHPLPLRSQVTVNLVIEERILDLHGTVVYLEALDDTRCCMGVQFRDLKAETRQALADYLARPES